MVDRENLLELAGSKHARAIFESIKTLSEDDKRHAYFNQLCRELNMPIATVNRYLSLLNENHVIEGNWEFIEVTEVPEKDKRHRMGWARVWRPKDTEERRTFEDILYGSG